MKKLWCLLSVFVISCVLTGCGTELTSEENRMIAEYAADLLLKYDANYQDRYIDAEETTIEEATEMTTEVTSELTTENNTTEVSTQAENSSDTSTEDEETVLPPSDSGNIQDIAEIIGLDGISITYNRCMFLDRYPSIDQDGAFIYLDADPGYKLVVVKFDIANQSSEDIMVDLLNTDIDYRLVLNRSQAAKPMLTILMDDLGTFSNTVPANTEQSAVLVFQMSDKLVDTIDSLVIRITYQNKENIIQIQ